MTDKEIRKLRRRDLLEMLIEAEKRNEELKSENQMLREQIEKREIKIAKAGSIAEAALQLNGVFEAAQAAAAQYLENIKRLENEEEQVYEEHEKVRETHEE